MTERAILFSTPMVQAILDGRKTQTRRVIKVPDGSDWTRARKHENAGWQIGLEDWNVWKPIKVLFEIGDRLWVRESHCLGSYANNLDVAKRRHARGQSPVVYSTERASHKQYEHFKWRPGIHMPRWASRLDLMVTDVRVQRLQEIGEEDSAAEGIITIPRSLTRDGRMDGYGLPGTSADDASTTRVNAFCRLWNKINGSGAWDSNPWVVAISFCVVFEHAR